jgi:hypothetical protein
MKIPDRTDNQAIRPPLQQTIFFLKAIFAGGWFALGNALLLIGGDDSVEIGFGSLVPLALNPTTNPISGNNNEDSRV